MDTLGWIVVSAFVTIIIGLIAVIYNTLVGKINDIRLANKNGLSLKVDNVEYKVTKEWQQELYADMKLNIKELRDGNSREHAGILLEIRRIANK